MRRRRQGGLFDFNFSSPDFDAPVSEAKQVPRLNLRPVSFDNAEKMAQEIDIQQDYICFTAGAFIFGDFIEALLYIKRLNPFVVYLTTLGMSRENVDSIVNMVDYLGAQRVRLLISHYFQGVERHRLIPYMEQEFSGRSIEAAVLSSHAKICIIRSAASDMLFIGSANLSSSNNVECFVITHDAAAVDYVQERLDNVFDCFTVFAGQTGKADHTRHRNTGRDAYLAMIKERVKNGR